MLWCHDLFDRDCRKISGGHNNETEVEYTIRKKNKRKEQWRERLCTDNLYDRRKKY